MEPYAALPILSIRSKEVFPPLVAGFSTPMKAIAVARVAILTGAVSNIAAADGWASLTGSECNALVYIRGCQEHFSPSAGGAGLVRDIQPH
jgi:hypothetical protein